MCIEVLKVMFAEETWKRDPKTKKGGYDRYVAALFEPEILETLFDEGDAHLKCSRKELVDVLRERLMWGIETYPDENGGHEFTVPAERIVFAGDVKTPTTTKKGGRKHK